MFSVPAKARSASVDGNGVGDARGGPARVLVVEDSPAILALIVDALELEGHRAHGTLDGAEAQRLVMTEPFDVVISDLVMPKVTGLSLLEAVKQHRPRLPVILVSGFATSEDAVDAARRGAFRVLRKPFPPRVLLDVVREALQARR